MKAIEFETISKQGLIKIPDKYSDFANKKVKVIVMEDEFDDSTIVDKLNKFANFQKFMEGQNITIEKNINIDEIANEVNL